MERNQLFHIKITTSLHDLFQAKEYAKLLNETDIGEIGTCQVSPRYTISTTLEQ